MAVVSAQTTPFDRETRALLHVIMIDFEAKKYDAALAKLSGLEKKYPGDPFILNLLGAVHTRKKDYANARRYFDLSLEKQPDFFPAKFNLGELLFLQRQYAESLGFFREMQQADPTNELLQFKVFLCLFKMDDSEGTEKAMKKIRYPGDTPAWYYAQAAL